MLNNSTVIHDTSTNVKQCYQSKSMDSVYSASSSKYSTNILNRRKMTVQHRQPTVIVPAISDVRQRVMSARVLRVKTLQNQIAEAHEQIAKLISENKILRSVHKRQDHALSKYESTNAELPKLLNSHAEEIRIHEQKYKQLQMQNRELQAKIKQRDGAMLTVTDQNKHLIQLNKDKNLEEREKLTEKVKELEQQLLDKDNEYKLLMRRLQLDAKNHKTQLTVEHQKQKDLMNKLSRALAESSRLTELLETAEKNFKPNNFSRSHSNIKSMRPRDHKSLAMNTSASATNHYVVVGVADRQNNGDIYTSNNLNHSRPLLPACAEKSSSYSNTSGSETYDDKSDRHIKSEKNEYLMRRENFPVLHNDIKNYNNRESDDEETNHLNDKIHADYHHNHVHHCKPNSNKKLSLSIKNGMANVSDIESSASSRCSSHHGHILSKTNAIEEIPQPSTLPNNDMDHLKKQSVPEPIIPVNDTNNNSRDNSDGSTSNSIEHPIDKDCDEENDEVEQLKDDIQRATKAKENLLDEFCEQVISPQHQTPKKQLRNVEINLKNYNRNKAIAQSKKNQIDPKKKVKLLAALKAIDSNESFDS